MTGIDLPVETIDAGFEPWVHSLGDVVHEWRNQDSGCISLGVRGPDGHAWFVKYPATAAAANSIASALRFHLAVRHPVIVAPQRTVHGPSGLALVYPMVGGQVLYDPVNGPGATGRNHPSSPHRRFRSLAAPRIRTVIDAILDAHVAVVAAGFVACDLYDGCVMYDFERHEVHLVDLDEYRPGPFRVTERLPGSTRFMAPEEWAPGATVDERTTVFNLGSMIREIGGAAVSPEVAVIVETATQPEPPARYASVSRLVAAWRAAAH